MTSAKNKTRFLIFLFSLTYFISYLTRHNFSAIISEIELSTSIRRSLLSMALTGSFITYGVGQLISGVLGDKVSPKRLISIGLVTTTAMNIVLPFCGSPYLMTAVWSVNGFAHSFMWPPLVKLMSSSFDEDNYRIATTSVTWGGNLGSVAVYFIAPLLIELLSWKSVFWFCACCSAVMIFFWIKNAPDAELAKEEKHSEKGSSIKSIFSPIIIIALIAIVLQGFLRDGVTTWVPTYLTDVFKIDNSISILTGVMLPLFGIACVWFASLFCKKVKTDIMTSSGFFFLIGTVATVILAFVPDKSMVLSVALSAILAGMMHAVNFFLIGILPNVFKKHGNVSTVAGILNACTYIGSSISSYGLAVYSENYGWNATIVVWAAVAALGTALMVVARILWRRKKEI